MILALFGFFVAISLVMIIIGLTKPTESAQALIGFFFLFLLSFTVSGNNLEYKSGEYANLTYSGGDLIITDSVDVYSTYSEDTGVFTTHRFGYFMAVASAIGLAGTLYSLKGGWQD